MIYLYCLLRATDPPVDLRGVDDSPVRSVDLGGLSAWVSDTPTTSLVVTPERARSHDRVVRTALERETPLPARFGQIVGDETVLVETLAARRDAITSALENVAGMVEMTARVLVRAGADARGTEQLTAVERGAMTGREYLEWAAAVQREERNLLADEEIVRGRVTSAVRELIRAESFAGATSGSNMATWSHLVPRENIDAYRRMLLALRHEGPAVAIMVSGPWAPYSFTQGIGA